VPAARYPGTIAPTHRSRLAPLRRTGTAVKPRTSLVIFGLVVALCLAQVGWWIIFQVNETNKMERAAILLDQGDAAAAARALGGGDLGEQARRRRWMFASEGATLGVLVLIGIILFWITTERERRTRQMHERFLAGTTHELKTPLATMRLGLQSLAAGRVSADRTDEYLETMLDAVGRLERGVANVLGAAGLHAGRRKMNFRSCDVVIDLNAVVEEMRPIFVDAGIELSVDAPAELLARHDSDAVRTILRNLLDNACKFCGSGDSVTVGLAAHGSEFEMRVADTGAGIAADEQPHVFEQFYRGTSGAHVGGSGLGLHLVSELAAAHGGRVKVRSEGATRGSEFMVRMAIGDAT